jgi:hypothetical protein
MSNSSNNKPIQRAPSQSFVRRYSPVSRVEVKGATAPSGRPWVSIKAGQKCAWVELADFAGSNAAREKLKASGMIMFKEQWERCVNQVQRVTVFPSRPLIERPGWSGQHFALVDGQVFSPEDSRSPVVLFEKRHLKCVGGGSLKAWKDGLADIVADQHLVCFALMVGFVAPLLELTDRYSNFGFELAGIKGKGKSTLQQLVASIAGAAVDPHGRNYWITANITANALEELMIEHSGMPMVIEETNLFAAGEKDKTRASKFDEMVFRLADGSTKGRWGGPKQERFRFIYLTSTNEPLESILSGHRPAVSAAAADRLLTLPVTAARPYGIFDTLTKGFDDSGAMAKQITEVIGSNFGVAMPAFLRGLVNARAHDDAGLRAKIKTYVAEFRKRAGIDLNAGTEVRVADAFGLVYAAGRLAKAYGALPVSISCGPAALACYQMNRAASTGGASMVSALLALATHPAVIRIDPGKLDAIDDNTLNAAPALLRADRWAVEELLLTRAQLVRAFPMPNLLLSDADVAEILQRDSDKRKTVKRILRKGHQAERVYCFKLPMGVTTPI